MANLNTTFFGSQDGVVDGNDSRTQGDENLNALANSLKLQCPNWATPISKTANEVNDCTEASKAEQISNDWAFERTLTVNWPGTSAANWTATMDGATQADYAFTLAGVTEIYTVSQNSPYTFTHSTPVTHSSPVQVNSSLTATGSIATTSGGIDALSGNVNALNVAASVQVSAPTVRGTSAVTSDAGVTATTFVSGDTWRVGNATAQPGVGGVPDAVHNAIEVFDESGTSLGYLYAFATAS